jgi:hypothetical protein
MTIEISEEKYWKVMGYDDGMLYCSLLIIDGKEDWRMPFSMESIWEEWKKLRRMPVRMWYYDEGVMYEGNRYWVIPVRDL